MAKEKKPKLKMRNAKYLRLHIFLLVLFLIFVLLINFALSQCSGVITMALGKSKATYTAADGSTVTKTVYYETKASDSTQARLNSEEVALKVGVEGEVLLKNNGVLPLAQTSEVMPFGYAYLNPAYSGTGAGAADDSHNVTPEAALRRYFTLNMAAVKAMQVAEPVTLTEAEGTSSATNGANLLSSSNAITEYDPSIYDSLETTQGVGVVFISRQGNEGSDKKMDGYTDGTPHYLALTVNEKETIKAAKEKCSAVVVILVSSNAIELSPLMRGEYEADAILWVGNPGSQGFLAMAEILSGRVNPSGRLVDIYPSDFTADPTYRNMGEFKYENVFYNGSGANYIEYQESVYYGYRYYETADEMDSTFVYGTLDENGGVKEAGAVCYPFGYGLSYTSFTQQMEALEEQDGTVTVKVKVTNTGATAGKEVVQLYYTVPYTDMDQELKIEKAAVVLCAFDKTELLGAGESEEVTLTFDLEDMASYCYTHENADGTTGCYMLEAGDYTVSLRKNSHDVIEEKTVTVPETLWYDNTNPRQTEIDAQSTLDEAGNPTGETVDGTAFVAATNQFQDSSDYMNTESTLLSRRDWTGTFPAQAENRTKTVADWVGESFEANRSFDSSTDPVLGNVAGSEIYTEETASWGEDNQLTLADLRGADYDDPRWDLLLNQIDYNADLADIKAILFNSGYQTQELSSIAKPYTTAQDGDTALNLSGYDTAAWMSKPVVASTWNVDLVYEYGAAFGQEALSDGLNGWYAPGMNIHRSPFAGRNLEYFSEDPYLTGKLAAAVISGAGDQGLVCYMKHFAVNDEETNRENYLMVWADEQTMREIYLKAFEIATKEARMTVAYVSEDGSLSSRVMRAATGVMTAQSCIGTQICFGNNALLTHVLRDEWNFNGTVITDLYFSFDSSLRDQMIRSGGDIYLILGVKLLQCAPSDMQSPTAVAQVRRVLHDVAYTTVNSAAMNYMAPGTTVSYGTEKWQVIQVVFNVLVLALVARRIVKMVRRTKDAKLHPENYKQKKQRRTA